MTSPRPRSCPPTEVADLADLAAATLRGDGEVAVRGITLDSRTVRPGDLYAALPGMSTHGGRFVAAALAAGAKAILTDAQGLELAGQVAVPVLLRDDPRAAVGVLAARINGHPSEHLTMYGVTGTNGKTTTAYLIASALTAQGGTPGLIGTVETRVGSEHLKSERTTPEASDLHTLLALMREHGGDSCVMEVSSHALVQHRVDAVVYDVALFTNLSQDHLDFHHTMENYFAAKKTLFTPEHARRGVVCVNDVWGWRLAREASIPVTTLSSIPDTSADWHLLGHGPAFTLRGPAGDLHLHCHLPGTFNLVNTAMAALALHESGTPLAEIELALAAEPVVPGRMEVVTVEGGEHPRCIVDFGHTPEAIDMALAALRPSTPGQLIAVTGAGGDRDRGKRPHMGAACVRHADVVIVTDDNPRNEPPETIRTAVLDGARWQQERGFRQVEIVDGGERARAIAHAVHLAGPRDTVVVLGKGHESGQEITAVVHPFDDRDAVRAALTGAAYNPEGIA